MATDGAAIRWQTGILRRITPRTARVKSFFFELPQPFAQKVRAHR